MDIPDVNMPDLNKKFEGVNHILTGPKFVDIPKKARCEEVYEMEEIIGE